VSLEHFDDPVAAYDRVAPHYAALTRAREPYLRGVEREIVSRIPRGGCSLLDVGSGDGTRALGIASQLGIERVVLVEPSKGMAAGSANNAEVWRVRAEDLAIENVGTAGNGCPHPTAERFAAITCLWNVLGHIPSDEKRLLALSAITRLLVPQGTFFLDVNHRYNLRSYGIVPTGARWIHDLIHRNERNGDVLARWDTGEAGISTYGHVFTHSEIMRLSGAAGLQLEERLVIDYQTGGIRRFALQGNLLYVFRRRSRIDSSSAPQTS
jgi:SAM-dependent methyltransferase